METVEVGKYINRDGHLWIVTNVTEDRNQGFSWHVVTAKWSGIGPRPVFACDDRTFFLNRKPIS